MKTLWDSEKRAISFTDVWGAGGVWPSQTAFSRVDVTVDAALGLSAVLRSVRLLSDVVSALPIHAYRGTGASRVRIPTQPQLITEPSLVLTLDEWLSQAMTSVLLYGNAYGIVTTRDRLGVPTGIEWVSPTHMTVTRHSALSLPIYRLDGGEISAEDVLHIRGFMIPGAVVGSAPLTLQRETIGLGIAAQKFGSQWFGDGATPSAVLTTDSEISETQATTIKARFIAAIRGTREPAVLGAGMKYQQIQVAAEESQFLETHQAVVNDIARAFGIPAEMIGGGGQGSSVTYANREQSAIDFLTFSVNPWLVRLESAISAQLPGDMFVKFNPDALLRTDTKTRYEAHQTALSSHFLTIDEVRALEDRRPLDNGEQFPPAGNGQSAGVSDQEVSE
jgi:HK97 family phage portal protein